MRRHTVNNKKNKVRGRQSSPVRTPEVGSTARPIPFGLVNMCDSHVCVRRLTHWGVLNFLMSHEMMSPRGILSRQQEVGSGQWKSLRPRVAAAVSGVMQHMAAMYHIYILVFNLSLLPIFPAFP